VSRPRALPTLLAATLSAGLLFALFPNIDLWLAERLYDRASQRFVAADWDVLVLYGVIRDGFVLLPVLAAVMAGLAWRWPGRFGSPRRWLFVLLTLATAGPLVADVLTKPVFGRPRPKAVVEYGGTLPFRPAFAFNGGCARNCSFVSSDVASAASLLAPALLVRRGRRWAVCGALGAAVLAGLARLAVGAHFLSDVVLAALLAWIVVLGLRQILLSGSDRPSATGACGAPHPLLAPPGKSPRPQR
jgi:membrane-associated PAP2 superfamily phosphatase